MNGPLSEEEGPMRRVALAFLLVAMSLAVWNPGSQAAAPDPAFAPDEILVQY